MVSTPLITLFTLHISGQNHFPHLTISFEPLLLPPYFQAPFPFSWFQGVSVRSARHHLSFTLGGEDNWGEDVVLRGKVCTEQYPGPTAHTPQLPTPKKSIFNYTFTIITNPIMY
jgi:hypothetical protein